MSSCTFSATKVFAHRWPHDTPEWTVDFKNIIESDLNTKDGCRKIVLSHAGDSVAVGPLSFDSLTNVGVSVPFFKRECRMMFEGACGSMHAHVHLYASSPESYVEIFESITRWMHTHGH